MNFKILYDITDNRLVEFLNNSDKATIYHHPLWLKAISNTFKHKPFYLLLLDVDENIKGLIPFIYLKSILTGKRIVSVPFSTYCDPILPADSIEDAIKFLVKESGIERIQLRTITNLSKELNYFSVQYGYVSHVLKLRENIDTTFSSFHPRSIRRPIRHSEQNNFVLESGASLNDLKIFYKLELGLRSKLSLPPLPFRFFENILLELSKYNMINIISLKIGGNPIASAFVLKYKDTHYLEYAASDSRYLNLYPNHKLYWEIVKSAQNSGAKYLDFGRTSVNNESLIVFKEKWNADRIDLHYYHQPKVNITDEPSKLVKFLFQRLNNILPEKVLQLEGNLLYPHLD